jgi:hypothetical protein
MNKVSFTGTGPSDAVTTPAICPTSTEQWCALLTVKSLFWTATDTPSRQNKKL